MLFGIVSFVIAQAAYTIAGYAGASDGGPADAAVVLGAAVWNDEPSPLFRERLNHALNLYAGGRVETLIFTGGVGIGQDLLLPLLSPAPVENRCTVPCFWWT